MVKILIITDDFTGAMDTGVQFSKIGIPTIVTTDLGLEIINTAEAEVVVVDTESRHLDANASYERVFNTVKKAKDKGIKNFYKKTDSTLRGNIGSELAAVLDATGLDTIYFIPAFPKQKRATKYGVQYVNSVPLICTSFANDPFTPVTSSFIPDIILQQTQIDVVTVTPENLISGYKHTGGKSIVVVDSDSDEDMDLIHKGLKAEKPLLTAGSAGFAEMLPRLVDFSITKYPSGRKAGKTVIICGSLNRISLEQMSVAERAGIPSFLLTQEQKVNKDYLSSEKGRALLMSMSEMLEEQKCIIIKLASGADEIQDCYFEGETDENGFKNGLHMDIAANVGALTANLLEKQDVDLLVVFGGDTLFGVASSMQCNSIRPQKEILPGIVQSQINFKKRPVSLVTKAGGFGEPDALIKILDFFKVNIVSERSLRYE